jgi:hypothetical protein
MNPWSLLRPNRASLLAITLVLLTACAPSSGTPGTVSGADDPQLSARGAVEVTARLEEVPTGAIFKRDLYDYATILKYRVLTVRRGQVGGDTIYVGHYNPWKPRSEAADRRVKDIGGTVTGFEPGQVHHLALEVPIEDYFMGGIVNKYFGQTTNAIYWAVWANAE